MEHPIEPSSASERGGLAVCAQGCGPGLALLHGGVGSWTHWLRNIPGLARHFRVVAFDLPGFGASPDVPPGLGVEDYLDWVADAIASTCSGSFNLAGFSFGGAVAGAVAARLGDRVQRLSLIAAGGFGVPTGRRLDLAPVSRGGTSSPDEARKALRHNLTQTMFADPACADDDTVELHRRNIARARFDSRKISLQDRLKDDLAKVEAPVQIVWGAQDRLAFPSVADRAERCRQARPDIRVDLVPEAGHWVQYERPDEVNRLLIDFLLAPEPSAERH
jgi:pimeloyl-ACP methyl ester carboxylesterase